MYFSGKVLEEDLQSLLTPKNTISKIQSVISIPWGVEVVWAVMTPKLVNSSSKIEKIVLGSIYCKPDSRKKTLLLDHIAEVFNMMNSKYNRGLHWILCGDTIT